MKFSSVILSVFFFSVTFAYSNSYNQASTSTNVRESQTVYQDKNIQNGNRQHRPDLQAVRATADVSNAYSKTQRIDKVINPPSPTQYNQRIGPESYYPKLPASQYVPNTQTTNYPDVNLHPQDYRLQHITSNPKIKALYAASKPTKRYTIIHSNGTIEHTDEIRHVAARHPNYVLVKAEDILSNNRNFNKNGYPNYSSQSTLAPPVQTSSVTNQNIENQLPIERSTSTFQQSTPFSSPPVQRKSIENHKNINSNPSTVKSVSKAVVLAVPSTFKQKNPEVPVEYHAPKLTPTVSPSPVNEVNSNNSAGNNAISYTNAVYEPIRQAIEKFRGTPLNAQQIQSDSSLKVKNTSFDKPPHKDAVAANPLPIYPTRQKTTVISDKPYVSAAAIEPAVKEVNKPIVTSTKQQPLLSLENKDLVFNPPIIKTVEEAIAASNSNKQPLLSLENKDLVFNPPIIKTVEEAIAASNSNIPSLNKASESIVKDQTPTVESTMSTKSDSNIPTETVSVILPQIVAENTQKEVETSTTDTTTQEASKPNIIVSEKKGAEAKKTTALRNVLGLNNNKVLESSKAQTETDGIAQSNITSVNNKETYKTVKEHDATSKAETISHTSTVANNSSETWGSVTPLTWFNLSEEKLWEAIKNNGQNVYFFFLPPKPKVSKEIRTTIFPNGTTIEEITEIVSDIGPDEEPQVKTRTRIL